jgi:hypothetical protein
LLPPRRIHWPPIAASALLGSAGQHPAFASLGHLATRQLGVAAKGIEPTGTAGAAARAAWAAATPAGTAWAAATAAARTAWATATAATIPIAATATTMAVVATRVRIAPRFRPWHQVQHIVEVALLLGVGRRLVAGKDAHQAQPGRALASHRECLHETRQAIALNLHRRGHSLGLGSGAKVGRWRFGGCLGRGVAGRLATGLRPSRCVIWRRSGLFGLCLGRGLGRRLRGGRGLRWLASSRGLASGRRFGRLFLGLGMRGTKSLLCLCRLSQENPGEFGDRLHERVLRVMGAPSRKPE